MKKIILVTLVIGLLLFTNLAAVPATAENIPKTPIWDIVQHLNIIWRSFPYNEIDIESYDKGEDPLRPGEMRKAELNISYRVERGKIGETLLHLYRNRLALIELKVDAVSSDSVHVTVEPNILFFPISEELQYKKAIVRIYVDPEMSEKSLWFEISFTSYHGRGPFGMPTLIMNRDLIFFQSHRVVID